MKFLSYFKEIYSSIYSLIVGMLITNKYLFKPIFTVQYPFETLIFKDRFRGIVFNDISDCIVCGMCARICPPGCINLKSEKRSPEETIPLTSDGRKKMLKLTTYIIDISKCMFCGLCTEVCPTKCLKMTKKIKGLISNDYYDRKLLIYDYIALNSKELT
ncbi:MAG: 4Fe-4S dicluster domain-containing protein [Candidatus Hydrogenedentota bacterium]